MTRFQPHHSTTKKEIAMFRFAVPLLLAALLVSPPAAPAQASPAAPVQKPVSEPAPEKTVAFSIISGDLRSALVQMEREYGIKDVVKDGVETHCLVNINMSDVPLSQAMRFIASAVNARVMQNSGGTYVFSPAPAASPQRPEQPAPQAQFSGSTKGYTQSFFGFRPLVPSDTLWPTAWLNSLGWQMRNQADGTTNRPKIGIDAPKLNSLQPSGVKRIFAL